MATVKSKQIRRTKLSQRQMLSKREIRSRAVSVEAHRQRKHDRAVAVWDALPQALRLRLIKEVVETRCNELRRAYAGVLSIGHGYRTVREEPGSNSKARGGKSKNANPRFVTNEPALAFLVRKKWKRDSDTRSDKNPNAIPKHIYTLVDISGERVLCAIPTDVEDGTYYKRLKPSSTGSVAAGVPETALKDIGVTCCAVRIPDGGDQLYALGCHHVFAMSLSYPQVPTGVQLWKYDGNGEGKIGDLSSFFGQKDPSTDEFFDAALVTVTDNTMLDSVVSKDSGATPITSLDQLSEYCTIDAPNAQINGTYVKTWDFFPLTYKTLGQVRIRSAVEWQLSGGAATEEGYSGSPVFNLTRDSFQGMHIAGDQRPNGLAIMLPATELFRARLYAITQDDDERLMSVSPPF